MAQTAPAAGEAPARVQDPVQGGWIGSELQQQQDVLEESVQDDLQMHQYNMEASFQQLRLERNKLLAANKGELNEEDRQRLVQYAQRLEANAPNSFEAHMAHFYAAFPAPASFQHLDRAAMRDAGRAELIGPKLADAARRNNAAELSQWSRAMRDRGEVAPGLWRFADDLLASVENNGILIAAGEMDAYPVWTRQFADGRRKDVLVIDQRLLGDPAYRQRIWEKTRARGKVPAEHGFIPALAAAADRPLFLSPALGRERLDLPQDELFVVGLALQYGREPIQNIPLLEQRWATMSKTTDAGPLSRNYLLPGVVLLKHYREIGDEGNAMRLEGELRALAKKLNAEKELYSTGLFH